MVFVSIGLTHALYIRIFVFLESSCDLRRIFCPKYDLLASIRWSVISSEKLLSPVTNEPRYKKLILLLNKPTRCSWAVTFISLVYHSTCFGRFLHPSSGVYNCICSPWYECTTDNRLPTWQDMNSYRVHVLPRRKAVVQCALVPGAAYTVIYSWWWVQEAPETCTVVNSYRIHILPRRKAVVRCALVPGAAYTVIYSWWWVQEAPETCRVVNKWNKKSLRSCIVLVYLLLISEYVPPIQHYSYKNHDKSAKNCKNGYWPDTN